MLHPSDIERRLLAALAEPMETAEARKRAFLDVLRVLRQGGERFAISGDLGLWLRAMRPGAMRLELALGSLESIPRAALQAEGFTVGKTTCSRQGIKIRFREVRPAALARAETFGRLSVLGASDLLQGKVEDANADWMPPEARRVAVVEAERLLEQNPGAADDVPKAKSRLDEAREKLTRAREIPMQKTKLGTLIGIAKELMTLFAVFMLVVGCDGGSGNGAADDGGRGKLDAGGAGAPDAGKRDTISAASPDAGKLDVVVAAGTCPLPAGYDPSKVTFMVVAGTVSCADPAYSLPPYAGLDCKTIASGAQIGTSGTYCCVPAGSNSLLAYTTTGWVPSSTTQPFCGPPGVPTNNAGKYAVCSATGAFLGWICATS